MEEAAPLAPAQGGIPPRDGDTARPYIIGGTLFIALLLFGVAVATWNMRANTLGDAKRALGQLGLALAEQTTRSVQGVDLALQDAVNRLADITNVPPAAFSQAAGSRDVHDMLQRRLRSIPQADALSLVDAAGQVANFTRAFPPPPIDVSDRDYFLFFKMGGKAETFLSAPVRNRGNNSWTVYLARRLSGPGGEFRGLILAAISLDYIEEFFRAVTTKPGSTVSLLRRDGILLAQFPHDESLIGRRPPGTAAWEAAVRNGGGTLRQPAGPDGPARLVSVRQLHDQPLVVNVSETEDAALAGWWRQATAVGLFSVLAAGCMALMLRKIARQFGAQQAAQHALTRRNAELEEARARLEGQAGELAKTAEALRGNERQLAQQSATLKTTLENIDQGLMMVGADGVVAAYNNRAVQMLGLPADLLARNPRFAEILQFQWSTGEFTNAAPDLASFLRGGNLDQFHLYERQRPNGRFIEVRSQPLPGGGVVRTYNDITERKLANARIRYSAHHDELTGLANRTALQERLDAAIAVAGPDTVITLLYLDLDHFKLVNDGRGHEVGDRLLIEVGRRIAPLVDSDALVARIGGDEFAIMLDGMGQEQALALASRLLEQLGQPYLVNGLRLTVGASIGIALYPSGGSSGEVLRRNADIAMYRAKDAGRNTVVLYEPAMSDRQRGQFLLEQDLREALGHHEFKLAYQPIVALESNAVVGYEALLRWTHPDRGAVPPQEFVSAAEATGLIVPLGSWVLDTACQEAAGWQNACRIAVNLSPVQFRHGGLTAVVQDSLSRSGLAPGRLELEVTEGVLLEDNGMVLDTMQALRATGVSFTLDDFGTGHASLAYLKRFPFDKIKIDRSYVSNLGHDPHSDAIVEATLLLGRRLDLPVVAEGVEEEFQLELLRQMRCPLVQGYLTGRPMAPELARAL